MNKIAKFEKVSFEEFKKSILSVYDISEDEIVEAYNNIILPKRATAQSAGYDFNMPVGVTLEANEKLLVPTGIRCRIEPDYVLMLYPRSGLGFKYGLRLRNTTGIIDADYYNADNEGHIMAIIEPSEEMSIDAGQRFMQGVFLPYGTTEDDDADGDRTGGFGSTGK